MAKIVPERDYFIAGKEVPHGDPELMFDK